MKVYTNLEIWMAAGSQHLYGPETLKMVDRDVRDIAEGIDADERISAQVICKGVVTTPQEITDLCIQASSDDRCAGVILWMHTFSPSKMWINGLKQLTKPVVHLHTQYHRAIPWDAIDMDYMNLHQSAHGGREHGYINARMHIDRKVIAGYWKDAEVLERLDAWMRAAAAFQDMQGAKICRFGDNMREVAVTEGDKVAAQIQFGYDVYAYGVSELAEAVDAVGEQEIQQLIESYLSSYTLEQSLRPGGPRHQSLEDAARLEAGLEDFLKAGGYTAFTTNFEDLHGLSQLPGLACQRMMEKGYGFGAEGDWKTAALVRAMKVMGKGKGRGTSFMEDYTYHLDRENQLVMGAHMLEVCPSIAEETEVKLLIRPLGIGGKDDPVRMVFSTPAGPALNASIMDMGNRFRLLVNCVQTVEVTQETPNLPVAKVLWKPLPDLTTAAEAWILAGGAHHTGFSKDVTVQMLEDFARMTGIEMLKIDGGTTIDHFTKELHWNELYYSMKAFSQGI